jgi:hypothetical protein
MGPTSPTMVFTVSIAAHLLKDAGQMKSSRLPMVAVGDHRRLLVPVST